MRYRPEIDGLRALAVVPVVLFHAGFDAFSGGYVGVDIFFVISGYLITSIILEEMASGNFTLRNFYLRRIRRIIPVLYFVTLATVIASWFILMPGDFDRFAKSVFGVATFSSNIVFWLQSGYFDTATELKPLLHTWSLAVEEQFYIFFPLLLLLLSRSRKAVYWVAILTILAISLAISQQLSFTNPNFAFYQLVTRAWELMLGAIVASIMLDGRWVQKKLVNEILGYTGLAMVMYAILFFDERTPFPGVYALIPTIGSGLIVLSTLDKTMVAKLLSIRWLVCTGLISYSIYLWHQPVLAFARYRSVGELSASTAWVIVLLVFPLSYLSWRFIEQPFRKNLSFKSGLSIIVLAIVCSSILLYTSSKTSGFSHRVSERVFESDFIRGLDLEILGREQAIKKHDITVLHKVVGVKSIKPRNQPIRGKVVILGDSHAMHLETGFAPFIADKFHLEVLVHSLPDCVATIGYFKIYDIYQKRVSSRQIACKKQIVAWRSYLESNKNNIDVVVLAGRWNWLINSADYGPRKVREDALWSENEPFIDLSNIQIHRVENFRKAVRETFQFLDQLGLKTVFISQVPLLYRHVKECDVVNDGDCAAPAYDFAADRQHQIDLVLETIPELDKDSILHYRPFDLFCLKRERKCIVNKNKYVYYRDRNHLSELGSLKLGQEFVKRHPDIFEF